MPSLRELWQRVGERDRGISQSLYDVVEALVEAVEPGDTPTDKEYNDARDDRIRFLQKELAEAKVDGDAWKRRCAELERLLAVQKASIADVGIGRLVLEMPDGTALQRTGDQYYAMRCHPKVGWRSIAASGATNPADALRAIQEVGDDNA